MVTNETIDVYQELKQSWVTPDIAAIIKNDAGKVAEYLGKAGINAPSYVRMLQRVRELTDSGLLAVTYLLAGKPLPDQMITQFVDRSTVIDLLRTANTGAGLGIFLNGNRPIGGYQNLSELELPQRGTNRIWLGLFTNTNKEGKMEVVGNDLLSWTRQSRLPGVSMRLIMDRNRMDDSSIPGIPDMYHASVTVVPSILALEAWRVYNNRG